MTHPLRILYVAAEVSHFFKEGGLGDVAASLPPALARLGHDVRVITPLHAPLPSAPIVSSFSVSALGRHEEVAVREGSLEGKVPVYLVQNTRYFERRRAYNEPDDLERYLLFARAVLEVPKHLGWQPDIIHCNDCHTAAIPVALRHPGATDAFYERSTAFLTIHNLHYRGFDHLIDFLCQGIFYADFVTTVSETYAREILTPEYGEGLEPLLRLKGKRLVGIRNGLDYGDYNPATDPYLISSYDVATLDRRVANKSTLQREVGLEPREDVPLVGMVNRLVAQKGLELAREAMDHLLARGALQFVLLGVGDENYHEAFRSLAARYPGRAAVIIGFDIPLAQRIYAGSDLFAMPSRYEPCGLGQLIAMRYGSIPVVRRTGGLADTVIDCDPALETGTGFVFQDYRASALLEALQRAVSAFPQRESWRRLMARAMAADFSWDASARQYVAAYHRALARRALVLRATSPAPSAP